MGRTIVLQLITATLLSAGCSKGVLSYERYSPATLAPGDAIAIILAQPAADNAANRQDRSLERNLTDCARRGLYGRRWAGRIVDSEELRHFMLPIVGPEPVSAKSVRDPSTQQQLSKSGLRYLVLVGGSYSKGPKRFSGGGAMGAGAFGLEWEVYSRMDADIIDLQNGHRMGSVAAYAHGTSVGGVALLAVLPIPLAKPSFPESVACRKLAEGVGRILLGE
jgi:hypothetical protein